MFTNKNRLFNAAALLLAGSSITIADVAPGFPLSGGSSNLTVVYNGNDTVSPPGELLPRPVTAQRPSIAYVPKDASTTTAQYILFMIDIDVPRNNTRVPLLHWLAPNTTLSSSSFLSIPAENPAPYLQPSPPVGDIPHAYNFILLPQPENFSIPAAYATVANNRVGFNVVAFLQDAGLGQGVLASNWITVQNTSGTPTTTAFPPPRPTQTGNGTGSGNGTGYQGPESSRGVGMSAWMGLSTVVLVGLGAVLL